MLLGSSRPCPWLIVEENGRYDDDDDDELRGPNARPMDAYPDGLC